MSEKKRYSIKNILLATLWVTIGAGIAVLLVAAIKKKDAQHCKGIKIDIKGADHNKFLDETDILNSITLIAKGDPVGKTVSSFNLRMMEKELQKNVWVKTAELFFDNNEMLQVVVDEREPIARVFTTTGASFYVDEDNAMLPLSEKMIARLPVFTNFPSDRIVLSKADSSLIKDIKAISLEIQKDSFRMAMIEQVDITPQRTFEMMPKMGNQTIVFGDASAAQQKFEKLELFYNQIMTKAGWNYYSIINLQYKDQVVAKRRGAEDVSADSLRTLQVMQMVATNAEKQASDSLQMMQQDNERNTVDSNMIQHSIQRDEGGGGRVDSVQSPKPQAVDRDPKPNRQPRAVMPPKRNNQ